MEKGPKRTIHELGFGASLAALAWMAMACATGSKVDQSGNTAAASQVPTEVLLRLKANKGDKYSMAITTEATADVPNPDGSRQTFTLSGKAVQEKLCTEVANGKMTWQEKNVEFTAQGTGPLEAFANSTREREKGKVTTKVKDELNHISKSDEPVSLAFDFPAKAIKPGDTWTGEGKLFDTEVKVTYKVERFQIVDGRTDVVISAIFAENPRLRTVVPAEFVIDTANGWDISSTGEFEIVPAPGVKIRMKLIETRSK